jgi:hypothetical protein
LSPESIRTLERFFAAGISNERRELLQICSGLSATVLGAVDFTGCFFPREPLPVFEPCITLAIDDTGRRWIAETSAEQFTGPVWCIFPDPKVALQVAADSGHFLATLWQHTCGDSALEWLHGLEREACRIWQNRYSAAVRPSQALAADANIRDWVASLPSAAFVYDLREGSGSRGWPYGLLGSSARLYRFGSLPVFAIAGWSVDSPYCSHPDENVPGSIGRKLPMQPYAVTEQVSPCRPKSLMAVDGRFPAASIRGECHATSG